VLVAADVLTDADGLNGSGGGDGEVEAKAFKQKFIKSSI